MVSGVFIVFYLGPTLKKEEEEEEEETRNNRFYPRNNRNNLLFIDFVLHYVFR